MSIGSHGGPIDMLIRPLTFDDEPFVWKALYYAIHVPPGEAAPAPDTVDRPDLACYVSAG